MGLLRLLAWEFERWDGDTVRKRSARMKACFGTRFSVAHPNAEIEDSWASQFGHWMLAQLDLRGMFFS